MNSVKNLCKYFMHRFSVIRKGMLEFMKSKGESNIGSFIGCGINQIEASGPYIRETTSTLFKSFEDDIMGIKPCSYHDIEFNSKAFDKLQDVFGSTGLSGGAGEAVAFFTGGFELKYEKNNNLSAYVKFCRAELIKEIAKCEINSEFKNPSNMKKIIKQEVLDDINDTSFAPEDLFKSHGTHIITDASIGGKIEFYAICRSNECIDKIDFENSLNASCKYFDAKGSLNRNSKNKQYLKDTTIRVKAYGGKNPFNKYGVFDSIDEITEKHKDWLESVDENPEITNVHNYIEIWKLADSEKRRTEIEETFYKLAKERYDKVAQYYPFRKVKEVALRVLPPKKEKLELEPGKIRVARPALYQRRGTLGTDTKNIMPRGRVKMLGWSVNTDNIFIMYTNDEDETVSFFSKAKQKFLTVGVNSDFDERYALLIRADVHQLCLNSDSIGEREKFKLEKCNDLYKIKSVFSEKYVECMLSPLNLKTDNPDIIFASNSDYDSAWEFKIEFLHN